ncbi:MauE/DoxX family redox-associated membrane protein [Novosphingobium sp. KN65.2]|uniref:MauE/DoxX family redox-associated membrane protein n=1 Tax=Novosphingobium sp. KN65.2 TaxID=1478134 RepID=UPI0005E3271C|nr:MauE/DoxX family redox-associated membrane protein [Novosphingobium sp. KN65.2]CDO38797.1 Glutaredoxin [Novosphingobium sp. KN65.2]
MIDPNKSAVLYRMVMEKHVCPFGLKSMYLLEKHGYRIDDKWLETREETDAFKARHDVETTPQTFIGGQRIGGYDDLRQFFGHKVHDPDEKSYKPVIAIFATAATLALAASWASLGTLLAVLPLEWFVSISMMLLAMLKLQDVEKFSTMFLGYDLLARRWVPYAYAYPALEWVAGALMTAHVLPWISIPVALFIGSIGAASVYYAVYVQKRELKCACVGGSGNVPLGFVSLTENLLMIGMGLWMLAKAMLPWI